MPPNTHFNRDVTLKEDGTVNVSGTLEDPDPEEDPNQVVVFAFVTQHQDSGNGNAKSVTVAGEARLYPVKDATGNQDKWWLASRDPNEEVPTHDELEAALNADPPRSQTFHYTLRKSTGWGFDAPQNGLIKGPAFGTAVSLTFKKDGTIETYAWSGWVTIAAKA
jgi:hypothetical protein